VRQAPQQPPLGQQPPPRARVVGAVRAQALGDAARAAGLAPGVVDVERTAAADVLDHPVAGRQVDVELVCDSAFD
jgi:hypothetical protein